MTELLDEARRQIGRALDVIGLGPQETPYRVVATFPGARLRAYADAKTRKDRSLLIIPAPFKRAYIWDLLPEVSVVRHCLARGVRVYLLEWTLPSVREDGFGLNEYADRLPGAAVDAIVSQEGSRPPPVLAGHSLGGTFAAIFASLWPDRVGGLVLVDAPLAFGKRGGPLAHAVAAVPHARTIRWAAGSPVPGSIINALSAAAAPDAFRLQPATDLLASLFDPIALAVHVRVARWAHDEFPLPGQLFEDVVERLYREDRFVQGTLDVGGRLAKAANLRAPIVAVVNPFGTVVPPGSVLEGLKVAREAEARVLEYAWERGPMLQHLGPLVAPSAHKRLWPEIVDHLAEWALLDVK